MGSLGFLKILLVFFYHNDNNIGAARGLAFLHTTEKQVIYQDFKASNILLDSDFYAKLSDFGPAKLGPVNGYSHVTTGSSFIKLTGGSWWVLTVMHLLSTWPLASSSRD
ncbi:unnamed protein product [Coffea canephora]|uniref:Protein kinase domain-containing protein n=1 Tax=Coffea canephora TaxID=49390 RepID=A0A068VA51_COFCA|nr:unnamed protein product [Coffea canephora]